MTVGAGHFESEGKSVTVTLTSTVAKDRVVVVQGWTGIANNDGDSGDSISLSVDNREYQVEVPSGLTVNKGDILYITVATVTGHYPDDAAFTTSAGSGKVAFLKATAAKDANNVVTGIMLAAGALAS